MKTIRGFVLPQTDGLAWRALCTLAALIAGVGSISATAQTAAYFTWTGAATSNVSNLDNWYLDVLPTASQSNLLNFTFDGNFATSPSVNVDQSQTLNSITFQNGIGFGINTSNASSITFTGGNNGGQSSGIFSTSTATAAVLITVPIILQGEITVSNSSSTNGINMSGNISGNGNIDIINTSSFPIIFTGVDSRSSGITTIESGRLQIGNGVSTTPVLLGNVADYGTLAFQTPASGSLGFLGNISGTGGVNIGGSLGENATFTLSGTNTYSGTTVLGNVTLSDTASLASFSPSSPMSVGSGATVEINFNEIVGGLTGTSGGQVNLAAGTSLQINTSGIPGNFSGSINGTGDGGVIIAGTGTTTFDGSSSYSGGTTVESGAKLVIANASGVSSTGSGDVTINSGGIVQFGAVGGSNPGEIYGNIVDNGTLSFGNGTFANPIILGNAITGIGGVSVPNLTAVDLTSNGNTYSGGTTISNGGYLFVSNPSNADSATGSGTVTVNNGGFLEFGLSGGSTSGQVSGAIVDNGTIAFNLTTSLSLGNTITGTGTVVDNLSGPITFSSTGTKSYTGSTVINSGALLADSAPNAFSSGSLMSIGSGGTLQINDNESIGGLSGAGTLSLNNAGATLTTTNTSSQTFSGTISGTGKLAISGTGNTILSGGNTYGGTTTVTGGTLVASNPGGTSATGTSAVTVASGATLSFGLSTGSSTGSVSGAITNNGSLVFNLTSADSFANSVSGTGTLTQNKASVLTLSGGTGALTYSGATILNNGTISDLAGQDNTFSPNSLVVVKTGTTLDVNSNELVAGILGSGGAAGSIAIASGVDLSLGNVLSRTFQGVISGAGGLTTLGSGGTTILTNANTFAGTTTIGAGTTLEIGDGNSNVAALAGPIVDNGTLILNQNPVGNTQTFSNPVSGTGSVSIATTTTLLLSSPNTYSGGTTMTASGEVDLTNTSGSALGTGTVTVGSSTPSTPFSGMLLSGSAAFAGALNLTGGGVLLPGVVSHTVETVTPGVLAGGSNAIFAGNSGLVFVINDANGTAGTNWNQITFAGGLSLTATPSAPIYLSISSLTALFQPGQAQNFDPTQSYSWQYVSAAGGITGFDPTAFSLSTAAISNGPPGFANSLGTGSFFISESGDALFVNFTPVPEPSTWVLIGSGIAIVGGGTWLRRRRSLA